MLLKRALFLVSAENEVEPLVEFAKVFKKRYNVKVDAVYVKDILKYDVFPITVEGIGINLGTNFAYKEFRDIENKTFEKIKEPLEKEFSRVYTKEGESAEIALEELKKYDLIVTVKNEKISPYMKELLRSIYKPVIVLPNRKDFKLDNLLLLDLFLLVIQELSRVSSFSQLRIWLLRVHGSSTEIRYYYLRILLLVYLIYNSMLP